MAKKKTNNDCVICGEEADGISEGDHPMSDDHVRIKSNGPTSMMVEVWINGEKRTDVTRVVWTADANQSYATAVVTFACAEVDVEGVMP